MTQKDRNVITKKTETRRYWSKSPDSVSLNYYQLYPPKITKKHTL